MKEYNANKVRIINMNKIISFYNSIGLQIAYKVEHNKKYPVVIDIRNNITYINCNFISNDKSALIYNSALFANNLLLQNGDIDSHTKETLDKQMYKYMNCKICLN